MKLNRTTLRATQILKLLASNPNGMTITEIGGELEIPKTSAFDIVQTLRQTHFLRESNKRFYIGFMAQEVGDGYIQEKGVYGRTKQYLIALAQELNLAGSLVFYHKGTLDYVFEHVPAGAVIAPVSNGIEFVHSSASGKVLIAFMSDAKQKKALAALNFTKFTNKTIRNLDAFKLELGKVKQQGYAVDDGEFNELMTCVSTPLFNQHRVVAAITLSGLQVKPEAITHIVTRLMDTAHIISKATTEESLSF